MNNINLNNNYNLTNNFNQNKDNIYNNIQNILIHDQFKNTYFHYYKFIVHYKKLMNFLQYYYIIIDMTLFIHLINNKATPLIVGYNLVAIFII